MFYIVTTFVGGTPIKEMARLLTRDEEVMLARDLGLLLGRLHHSMKPKGTCQRDLAYAEWKIFISHRRQNCYHDLKYRWNSMPDHLLAQLDTYLPAHLIEFIGPDELSFIHCDIIRDHVLLTKNENGDWRISGLIDLGDARYGDPFYELAALHTNLFLCDREVLARLIEGYTEGMKLYKDSSEDVGFTRWDFCYRAMVYLLLYEFNQFENIPKQRGIFVRFPQYKQLATLEELAVKIWDVSEFVPDFPKM